MITAKVEGLREVDAALAALGSRAGTRILRTAMLRATKPILEAARANVASRQRGSGALHKSLGMKFVAGSGRSPAFGSALPPLGGRFRVQVTPFRNDKTAVALYNLFYKRRVSRIYYGHLIEFGFRARGKQVSGAHFLRSALDANASNAVAIFTREVRAGIDRELKKRARKARKK